MVLCHDARCGVTERVVTRDVIAGGVPTQSRSDDEKDHEEDGEDGEGYFEVESVEGIIPFLLLSDRVLPRLTTWTRGVITLESRYYGYSKTPDFGARCSPNKIS